MLSPPNPPQQTRYYEPEQRPLTPAHPPSTRRPVKGSDEAKAQMKRVRQAQVDKSLSNHPVKELRRNAT